jgi:hypothetical protein
VLRFFEPGLRPELPLANGRPRVAEVPCVSGPLDRRMALIHQLELAQISKRFKVSTKELQEAVGGLLNKSRENFGYDVNRNL